jgi:hypothetical protein
MHTTIKIARMVPGALSANEISKYIPLATKHCKGCGEELDYWGRLARNYHSQHCPFKDLDPFRLKKGDA